MAMWVGALTRAGYQPAKARWMVASAVRWCRPAVDSVQPIRTELAWYAQKLLPAETIPCRPDIESTPLAATMVPLVHYWHGIPIVDAANEDSEEGIW